MEEEGRATGEIVQWTPLMGPKWDSANLEPGTPDYDLRVYSTVESRLPLFFLCLSTSLGLLRRWRVSLLKPGFIIELVITGPGPAQLQRSTPHCLRTVHPPSGGTLCSQEVHICLCSNAECWEALGGRKCASWLPSKTLGLKRDPWFLESSTKNTKSLEIDCTSRTTDSSPAVTSASITRRVIQGMAAMTRRPPAMSATHSAAASSCVTLATATPTL